MDNISKIMRRVAWSNYVTVITVVCCLVFVIAACVADDMHIPIILFACIGIVMLSALYYSPMSVTMDRRNITIRRMLTSKRIPMAEVVGVRLFQRSLDVRICGSGGFFGYYGWFRNRDHGKYFAYIGKWKDTFLIELKSGRKYVVSCNQPEVIVKCIMDCISRK